MTKLIFGCGYLGSRVARLWQALGEDVYVVTRTGERARHFVEQGFHPIVADVLRPDSLGRLPQADSVLFSVGFDRAAGASIFDVYVAGLRDVLATLPDATGRLLYISTTGVYGQTAGERVDETSPTDPPRDGGRASLAAERALFGDRLGDRGIVLRLAGIYGPGRIPLSEAIRQGEAIPADPESYLNLIHVDDAARAVVAADQQAVPPCTYVVSDGQPVLRRDYYTELARLLGAPPPRFAAPADPTARRGRSSGSKRIDPRRMFDDLGLVLEYPSYREGLAAIVADGESPPATDADPAKNR